MKKIMILFLILIFSISAYASIECEQFGETIKSGWKEGMIEPGKILCEEYRGFVGKYGAEWDHDCYPRYNGAYCTWLEGYSADSKTVSVKFYMPSKYDWVRGEQIGLYEGGALNPGGLKSNPPFGVKNVVHKADKLSAETSYTECQDPENNLGCKTVVHHAVMCESDLDDSMQLPENKCNGDPCYLGIVVDSSNIDEGSIRTLVAGLKNELCALKTKQAGKTTPGTAPPATTPHKVSGGESEEGFLQALINWIFSLFFR